MKKLNYLNSIYYLCSRCEAGLGNLRYEKAYEFLIYNQKIPEEEKRDILIDIIEEKNIGYWHLLYQQILYERLLSTVKEKIEKK